MTWHKLQSCLILAILSHLCIATNGCPPECYCHDSVVDCYDRDLDEIPEEMPITARSVNLRRNQITRITPGPFSSLSDIHSLILNKNQIRTLETGCLANLTTLEQLDLSDNAISEIQADVFTDLHNLQILQLNNNQLKNVGSSLSNIPRLENLNLISNQIESIHDVTFMGLDNLMSLSLSKNKIKYISKFAFAQKDKLSYLFLNENPLVNVNGVWDGLSDCKVIDLSSCQLTKFPAGLPTNLKLLDIANNSLTIISATDWSQNPNLNIINLDNNQITTIEDGAFIHVPHLLRIRLSGNRLRMLPSPIPANITSFTADNNDIQRVFQFNFDHDSKMAALSLKNNSIEALAANTFSRMASLNHLYLDDNNIQVMHQMTFSRLRRLTVLSLANNPIQELEMRALGGIPRLGRLILSGILGKVSGLDGDTFREVPSLTNLDLQGSAKLVTSILNSTEILRSLRSIKYINLMNTNLTTLDASISAWWPKLRSIAITDNPWICDAKLIPLRKWMQRSPLKFSPRSKILCQEPDFLKGTPVIDVPMNQFTATLPAPVTTTQTQTASTQEASSAQTSLSSTAKDTRRPKSTLAPVVTQQPVEKSSKPTSGNQLTTIAQNTISEGISSTQEVSQTPNIQSKSTSTKTTQSMMISSLQYSKTSTFVNTIGDRDSSSQQPYPTAKTGNSRLATVTSPAMDGKTKVIVIGVSTALACIVLGILLAILIVRHRKRHKRVPIDHTDFPIPPNQEASVATSHQLHGTDTTGEAKNGSLSNPDSVLSNNDHKDSARSCNKKSRGPNMNCFSPKSHDDSEMLVYSWDGANH